MTTEQIQNELFTWLTSDEGKPVRDAIEVNDIPLILALSYTAGILLGVEASGRKMVELYHKNWGDSFIIYSDRDE